MFAIHPYLIHSKKIMTTYSFPFSDFPILLLMKRFLAAAILLSLPLLASASALPSNATSATVLIANYDSGDKFIGWGSGFFVDDAIVVTNKHVIQNATWYRVYATTSVDTVDFNCFKSVTKSDLKINLHDDVAYIRAYLPCDHGKLQFAEDPQEGDPVSIVGYPYKGSESFHLTVSTGSVIGRTEEGWLSTDAILDFGSSGGPVLDGDYVLGVAVAKGVDTDGNYIEGFFIPSSVILQGLLYANDSHFGYTQQSSIAPRTVTSGTSSSASSSSSISSSASQSSASSRSSSAPSFSPPHKETMSEALQRRTCERVTKWFWNNPTVLARVNARLERRFGFECS